MHLQQTKVGSRATGGPQYFFHTVPDAIKDYLRRKKACPVVLQTPYGIAPSPFLAVSRDAKVDASGKFVDGKVGHDRIQQAGADESIGEATRRWYGLPTGCDFERIDVDVHIHGDGHFILTPCSARMRGKSREINLRRPVLPLSFHRHHQSDLWRMQITDLWTHSPDSIKWAFREIKKVVNDHILKKTPNVDEADLLRTAGALGLMGMRLGPYLTTGYDCDASSFQFLKFPEYVCPVEVKKISRGFKYQMLVTKPLPRAVVLCMTHNLDNIPEHVDVVELSFLKDFLQDVQD